LREQPPVPFADEESGSLLMPPGPLVFYGYAVNPRSVSSDLNAEEGKMKTTVEILTQVSSFVPTTGLVLNMSRYMEVYTSRPMLFRSEIATPVMEQQLRQAA
jgi:hypothetical protein